ncbi:hypothetical protein [Sphingobacterium sp. HMA12]|uniref:hypothetical protein n=1 Tax=Sphingobacterium sp. HMA12 TaxID=2050894 RepID=UPI000CEA49A2|nr:hypothetical protein [Sphingobacterium sp. HMA12]
MVYKAVGGSITEKTYTNSVDNTAEFALDAEQTYTFVSYSIYCSSSRYKITGRIGECLSE